ncbi:MAG: ATP-binding protein [Sandaracinaceae bacterium]
MSDRVLVVEDNRDLAENIQELFEEVGAKVVVAKDAQGALSVGSGGFDLAIVDMRLPAGTDGLTLAPRLREIHPAGEVILMTGNATLGSAIEAVRHGLFAYVQKPFDPEHLLTLGQRALAQVRLREERAALAQDLSRSEALHRAVVESVDSLIIGMDEDQRVRMWNRSATETLGWASTEVLDEDVGARLFRADAEDAFRRAAVAAAQEGVSTQLRLNAVTRDGRLRCIRWRVTPMSPEGSRVLVLAVGTDVTERLALEARAAEAEAMAALGRLTAGLAHEIRNPLNAATLQLELMQRTARQLEDGDLSDRLTSRVGIVRDELSRLSHLLDEFLGFARPGLFQLIPVDVQSLLEQVAYVQRPVAEKAGVELTCTMLGGEATVLGDEGKLKQALVNLVVNALDAVGGQEGGAIRLVGEIVDADAIEIRVEDNGPGVDESRSEDVFRPFVTTKVGGTGLGLPIVRKIAELHGGTATIAARPEGGTQVSLRLRRPWPERGIGAAVLR